MVVGLVCHMEHTTCQGLHPLQGNDSRTAKGGIPLDGKHSMDTSQDEAWTWQSPSSATFCCSSSERSQQDTEAAQLKFEPPPSRLLNDTLKGLMRVYMDEHGLEALEPHRTEPIPHSVICLIMGLLRQTATHHDADGKEILRVVADDLQHFSLRALVATHMQTGLGKAETTSKTKEMTLKDMTRSNVTWNIDGIYVIEPTKRQLQSMV